MLGGTLSTLLGASSMLRGYLIKKRKLNFHKKSIVIKLIIYNQLNHDTILIKILIN